MLQVHIILLEPWSFLVSLWGILLAPFLDRGPERRPAKRPFATGFMLLALAGVVYLTWESAAHHDWEASKKQGAIVEGADIDKESEGYQIMDANGCISCHGAELTGGPGAPSLVDTGLTPEEIAKIAVKGQDAMPAGMFKGTDEELQKLAEFVSNLSAK